jgi:hypothetical protein
LASVDTFLILIVAAATSAGAVWLLLAPSGTRRRIPRRARLRPVAAEPPALPSEPDSFVLLPVPGAPVADERPPRARSVLLLAATIALIATLAVAALALIGIVLKAELDRYFTGGL